MTEVNAEEALWLLLGEVIPERAARQILSYRCLGLAVFA